MDGIFIRKKPNAGLILVILFGLFSIALYLFPYVADTEASSRSPALLFFGIFFVLVPIPIMLMNCGAYLRIEENSIHGRYHLFGRLNCRVDEVEFAFPQVNMLTILLKNGRRHIITGVENPWPLSSEIRRHNFTLEAESPNVLQQRLSRIQSIRKKEIWWACGIGAFMFINVLITVLLTGGRDFHEFSELDWVLFAAMGFIELLTLVGLFYVADRGGKRILPIEQLKHRLRGAIIAVQPLPPNSISIYTDENYACRIVVCGFPNDEGVYFCIQEFTEAFELKTIYTSEVFDIDNESLEYFSHFFNITSSILSP